MALTLDCSCGARFEVEVARAGQVVNCPECQAPVEAPALDRTPPRTSGLALASLLLALVGAFTIFFTVLAVLLGLWALVGIRRNRDRLAGTGYAAFGIVAGIAFTILSLFLYSNVELLPVDGFAEASILSSQVDYEGDREVVRNAEGFSITRPSAKWGVARKPLLKSMGVECDLMLVNAYRHCYAQVMREPVFGRNLSSYVDDVIKASQQEDRDARVGAWSRRVGGFKLRQRRTVPKGDGTEIAELVYDFRFGGEELTYVEQIHPALDRDQFYRVRAWSSRRRFTQMEPELRRAIDSFRLLP